MRPRNVALMVVLVLLCLAGYLAFKDQEPAGSDLPAVWPRFERADAERIVLRNQAGDKVELLRRKDRKDRWDVLQGADLVRADGNAVDDLLSALSRQSVTDRVLRSTIDGVARFGLDKPIVEVVLTVAGKAQTLRYGKLSLEGQKLYMDEGEGTDVWIVPKEGLDLAIAGISSGLLDQRLFEASAFDVTRFEVVKKGVTAALLTRDIDQIWHFEQPFRGYANPTKFDDLVGRIVNAKLAKRQESGAVNLAPYGLDHPELELRIGTRVAGRTAEALLMGSTLPEGTGYALEEGTRSVVVAPKELCEAAARAADPLWYRDRSFTRLGNASVIGVDVNLDKLHYVLRREGANWDVTEPERHPGDGEAVNRLLALFRAWQTQEFLDAEKPEDHGVDGKSWVAIDLAGTARDKGARIQLDLGERVGDTIYAVRKGDGQLERVDVAPIDELGKGVAPWKRKTVDEWRTEEIEEIDRDKGYEAPEEKVQTFAMKRDVDAENKSWTAEGLTGKLDADAINGLLGAVRTITAIEWLPHSPERDNEPRGFKPPTAATMTLRVHFKMRAGMDPGGEVKTLYVGRRRAEGGGYYARFFGAAGGEWAFVLADAVVEALMRRISKD